jgi:hypothetical protein
MLLLDERRAINAIPAMLAADPELAIRMKSKLDRMIELVGVHSKPARSRLAEVEALFEREEAGIARAKQTAISTPRNGRAEKQH